MSLYSFSYISNEFWKIYFSNKIDSFEEVKNFIKLYKFTKEDLEDIPRKYNEEKKYTDIYTYIQDELDGKHTLDYIVKEIYGNQPNQSEIEKDKALKYRNCIEENKIEDNYDFIFKYAMKKTEKKLEVKKDGINFKAIYDEKFFLTFNEILQEDLKEDYLHFIEITKEKFMKEEINISSNLDKENFLVSFLEIDEIDEIEELISEKKELFYLLIIIDRIILSDVIKEVIQKDFESFLNMQIKYIKMMFSDNREKHLFSFSEIDRNNATSLKVLIEFLVNLEENDFQKSESDFLEIITLDKEQYSFIYKKMIKSENPLKYLFYLLKIDIDKVRNNNDIEKILEEAHHQIFLCINIWKLLSSDKKYIGLLEELKKSKIKYVSDSAISCLIRNYEKQGKERSFGNEYYKEILDKKEERKNNNIVNILEEYSNSNKPLIITEGKTDWKHLKKALERFQAKGEYKNLDIDFLEYEETDMGDSELATMVRTYSKGKHEKKHIMIFDRDATEKKDINNIFNPKEYFTNHGNKVYALFIPPIGRLDKICIEFYYKQEEVQEAWFKGKRLFYGNEFDSKTQKSICDKYKTDKPHPKDLDILDGDNKKKVYKIDDEEKKENNIALSKNKFSENILKGMDGFNNFNIENFRLIFDEIERIVND